MSKGRAQQGSTDGSVQGKAIQRRVAARAGQVETRPAEVMQGFHDGQAIPFIHPKHSPVQYEQLTAVHELACHCHASLHAWRQLICSTQNSFHCLAATAECAEDGHVCATLACPNMQEAV